MTSASWHEPPSALVEEWRRLSRSRRELAALDEHQLKDIGIARSASPVRERQVVLAR